MSLFDNSFPFRSCPVCRERELKEAAEKDMQQRFWLFSTEQVRKEKINKLIDKLDCIDNENVGET